MPLFRHLLRHPLIALCNVLGIALGVAVFLAMQTSNRSANRAFAASIDLVSGKAHAELRSEGSGFDETLFADCRKLPAVAAATAMVETYATLPKHPGDYVHILGVDVFTAPPFQTASFKPEAWRGFDLERFIAEPGQVIVPGPVAKVFGWKSGQRVEIEAAGRRHSLTILHVVPSEAMDGSAAADSGNRVVLMDIGWAQEMLGQAGKIQAIQFLLHDPTRLAQFLSEGTSHLALPAHTKLSAPQNRTSQIQTMVEGFQLNLTALSMVSMLVGVFLVYNTVSASTVRRRKEIGILRALGASRAYVMRHFLAESLLYAVPGVVLGIWAGQALASVLAVGIAETLSSRYLLVQIRQEGLDYTAALMAAGYGLLAALFGAARPAWEAARQAPVLALHPGSSMDHSQAKHRLGLRWAVLFALATPGFSWLALQTHPIFAFAACLTCVLACTCIAPLLAQRIAGLALRGFADTGKLFALGTEAFERSLHRTGLTIAALLSAVAMLVSVATMVSSFRETVDRWIVRSMDADLYLALGANEVLGMHAFLPEEVQEKLQSDKRVSATQGYREEAVWLPECGRTTLTAVSHERAARFEFLATAETAPLAAFDRPGTCFINESFARKFAKQPGETLTVPTPTGEVRLKIVAIFRDYSDDRGRIFLALPEFARLWNDQRIHSLGLTLVPDQRAEDVASALRQELAPIGTFSIYTQGNLRQRVLEIFDQTFAITGILRSLSIAVAVLGVVLALLVLALERAREISLLRALGASTTQVIGIFLVQAAWVGALSALLGILCGLAMAWLLVAVVNPAFFGWTIPLHPVWRELAVLPVWLTAVAALAGLYPAWRASRTPIAPALRME